MSTERDFATQYAQPELVHMPPPEGVAQGRRDVADAAPPGVDLSRYLPWERELIARNAYPLQTLTNPIVTGTSRLNLSKYLPWEIERIYRDAHLATISSRLAREVVLAAHTEACRRGVAIPWVRHKLDYLHGTAGDNENDRAYRQWVRHSLRKSGLAMLLPGGRAMLPDIFEPLPQIWHGLERLLEPRNHKQLAAHLARYLDWYLAPSETVPPPVSQLTTLAIFGAIALVGLTLSFGGIFSALLVIPLAAVWLWLWVRKRKSPGRRQKPRSRHNFYSSYSLINATELFYYLFEAYADPREK